MIALSLSAFSSVQGQPIDAKLQEALPSANFSGQYFDRGVDTNGDGQYELMAIDVGVIIRAPGEYGVQGYLYDKDGGEIAWSIDHRRLTAGNHTLELDFDGRAISRHGIDGPYRLGELYLLSGNSDKDLEFCDYIEDAYNTSAYRFTELGESAAPEEMISGSGKGEFLLTVTFNKSVPVFSGRYSLDLLGIHVPPFSSAFEVFPSRYGYAYEMGGVYLPRKPNDFTVTASGVENLNIGLKKLQGSYENSSSMWIPNKIRTWVTTQIPADEKGTAVSKTDLISPGEYQVRVFGSAQENVSRVDITVSLVKKVIVDGNFSILVNTTGYPTGSYSLAAKAINGSLVLKEFSVGKAFTNN